MFSKGDKVVVNHNRLEGFFLESTKNGNARILKRDYALLGKFDLSEKDNQYVVTVPLSSVELIEGGCFTYKGYHHFGHGSIKEISLSEIQSWLERRHTKKIYFVLDNHLDMYHFCGLGKHLPVLLGIMKQHYGVKRISRKDISHWSKLINENFVFYNGAVHDADHYARYMTKRI